MTRKNVNNMKKVKPQLDANAKKILNLDKQVNEMEEKLKSMKEDRDKKCESAKKQLIDMLDITVDKYRTATGTAEALRVLRFVYGKDSGLIKEANDLAWQMASDTKLMVEQAKKLDPNDMDSLCDGFYTQDLKLEEDDEMMLAHEMMCIDLCRNVGPAAEDMVDFIKRVNGEIEETEKVLSDVKHAREQEKMASENTTKE